MAVFRFSIEDVFSITGRGVVVTGTVVSGSLRAPADVVVLHRGREQARGQVAAIEGGRVRREQVVTGDEAGLLLRGIDRGLLRRQMDLVRADEFDRPDTPDPAPDAPSPDPPPDAPSPDPTPDLPPETPPSDHPSIEVAEVTADHPLLLLPLRLETRYAPDRAELWIRAWPDQIHLDTHVEAVTDEELALGTQYWAAGGGPEAAAVFERMAVLVGRPRAIHLREVTAPGGSPRVVEDLWQRRPMARGLPDHLLAVAVDLQGARYAARGSAIPAKGVPVGPGPQDTQVVDGGPLAWMADFAEAQAIGLGLVLPLASPGAALRSVTVLGVSSRAGDREFDAMLRAHERTTGLRELTPLAATKGSHQGPWPATASGRGRERLRGALGLPGERPRGAEPAPEPAPESARGSGTPTKTEIETIERAARRVVWEAAVRPAVVAGFGLDAALKDGSPDEAAIGRVAHRYCQLLRAYGPLPTIGVGDQPYAILPVTATSKLDLEGVDQRLAAQEGLTATLARAAERAREEETALGGTRAMFRALSRSPDGQRWRGRPYLTGPVLADLLLRAYDPSLVQHTQRLLQGLQHVRTQVQALGADPDGLFATSAALEQSFLVCAPLVTEGADRLPGPDTLDPDYLGALLDEPLASFGRSAKEQEREAPEPRPLLDCLAESAVLQVLGDLAALAGEAPERDLGVEERTEPTDPSRRRRLISERFADADWSVLDALATLDPPQAPRQRVDDARLLAEAVRLLRTARPTTVHAAVAAALDLASTRVDAWLTSFASERLDRLREQTPSGLHLGAFGVVEDLRPALDPEPAAFHLAPSMEHATTAALLDQARAGLDEQLPGLLDLQLTAPRVRAARRLAALLHRGVDLGEALGHLAIDQLAVGGAADLIGELAARYPAREGIRPEGPSGVTARATAERTGRIDGLALLEDGDDPPGADAELMVRVRTTLDDAVAGLRDVLLAEGVHDLAHGRTDAAAAALGALGHGEPPPGRLDVLDPPRRGSSVGFHVALLVDPLAPAGAPEGDDEAADPSSPEATDAGTSDLAFASLRRLASPVLDRLVARLVGPMVGGARVVELDADGTELRERTVDLAALPLAAIDLAVAARPGRAPLQVLAPVVTEILEGLTGSPWGPVRLEPSTELADVLWAIGRAGDLLASARPLTSADLPGAGSGPDERPAARFDASLEVEVAQRLQQLHDDLDPLDADTPPPVLRAVLLRAQQADVEAAAFRLEERRDPVALARRAGDAVAELADRLNAASHRPAGARLSVLLPQTPVPGVVDVEEPPIWGPEAVPSDAAPGAIGEWIEVSQQVRPRLEPLADLWLAGADTRAGVRAVQWPLPADVTDPPAAWIGGPHDTAGDDRGQTSLIGVGLDGGVPIGSTLAGLVVDEWEEVVPDGEATLGVVARMAAPPSRAPQVPILAVPAGDEPVWTLQRIEETIAQTVHLAKARTVDLRDLPPSDVGGPHAGLGWLLPLLWVPDHETDLRATACPPDRERKEPR